MPKVLGIDLYSRDIESFILQNITATSASQDGLKYNKCVSATGAHGLVQSKRDIIFGQILSSFFCNLPDGMPAVWIGRLKGAKTMRRCYGPDFFKKSIIATKDTTIRHYFCGGKRGIAEELREVCNGDFGNHNIAGVYSPPFRELSDTEMKGLADEINVLRTDIVWIGLSTPKQEIFAHRLARFTNVHFICTVGAAFDFHTKRLKQAPKALQALGLEWLFRFLMEPKRLWKRYAKIVPLFMWYNLLELINGRFFKNQGEGSYVK